ncbi:hypothetical protein [Pantoea sp. SORGH_AS_0659]|uniref:hypothetical protein n=1 Tax=Pantoea sp. SORGH_AS_0659 TaxID=3062597 RepID=UPI002863822E|nr:hypothetical protein [Pantoea sp. SORGH_AS_0659]MDR6352494.1 hypothetical protein [Pantoea sp. SORGH_AS_0659]
MKKSIIHIGVACSLLFLTACSSTEKSASAFKENEGMVSLLAATMFVREHCQTVDVPSDSYLTETLSKMSIAYGHPLTSQGKSLLSAKAGARYVALMRDEASLDKKCNQLVPLTETFIRQARQVHTDK